MLISGLLVPANRPQYVYDSREIENNVYYEGFYTTSYRRSPFNVETNAFNALLGIERAWFVDADQVQLLETLT